MDIREQIYVEPVERTPSDQLRNQLQNINAVAWNLPDLISREQREAAKTAIETAVSTIMEKVAPALTDERTE